MKCLKCKSNFIKYGLELIQLVQFKHVKYITMVTRQQFHILVEKILKLQNDIRILKNEVKEIELERSAGQSKGERLTATYTGQNHIQWNNDKQNSKDMYHKFLAGFKF
jgi:hypothetical protein